MDPKLALTLVGISHRTAQVAVRERYVVSQTDLASALSSLLQIPGVTEAFVLSTCNRTEVIVVGEHGVDLAPPVRAQVFRNLADDQTYIYRDTQALIHVFRTAAGLDSVVVGESEILAQLKRGADTAQQMQALGPLLKPLLQHVLHAGKRVRSETEIGQGTLSVARVAVDIATRVFSRFDRCSALIVGAGETGLLVAKHLKERSIGTLAFANRTIENAEAAAAELGAQAYGLDALSRLVPSADLVIACVEGGAQPIDLQAFDAHQLSKRERPQLVIDLSVPRAVAPEIARRPNLLLYDLDDLARVVQENRRGREGSSEGSAEILVAELHKFLALRTYASFTPAIAAMRERFDSVRDEVLDSIAGARSDPKDVELAHVLSKRLLDTALAHMKESARQTRSEDALDREYQRFLENL